MVKVSDWKGWGSGTRVSMGLTSLTRWVRWGMRGTRTSRDQPVSASTLNRVMRPLPVSTRSFLNQPPCTVMRAGVIGSAKPTVQLSPTRPAAPSHHAVPGSPSTRWRTLYSTPLSSSSDEAASWVMVDGSTGVGSGSGGAFGAGGGGGSEPPQPANNAIEATTNVTGNGTRRGMGISSAGNVTPAAEVLVRSATTVGRFLVLAALAFACTEGPMPTTETGGSTSDSGGPTTDSGTDSDTEAPVERVAITVATWNLAEVGRGGERDAVVAVLRRLDADIVALNEVDGDEGGALRAVADALGFDHVYLPSDNPFGGIRNAIISRHPFVEVDAPTSAELSGDDRANDLTRWPVVATVDLPDVDDHLTVVAQHWKSGFYDEDAFRRAVDGQRTAQAAGPAEGWVVVAGDMNAELGEPERPASFGGLPDELPGGYWLGRDLYDLTAGSGLPNDTFGPLEDAGYAVLDTPQLDGSYGTREPSDKRLDYLWASPDLRALPWVGETYDPRDEGRSGGVSKAGEPAARDAVSSASDHYPVAAEFQFPKAE